MKKVLPVLAIIVAVVIGCAKDDDPPATPGPGPTGPTDGVVFDPDAVPYLHLSEYRFFTGALADQQPNVGVLPFDVITPLFTDYAKKKRFVWMAEGARAEYAGDEVPLTFADNTVLIKNFYYDNVQPGNGRHIMETRLMIRTGGQWRFATYVWNDEQTEATLDEAGNGVNRPVSWTDGAGTHNIMYRIPSGFECLTCHKVNAVPTPIGPKPQNINKPFAYADGTMGQLAKWQEVGYLAPGVPSTINTTVAWDDATQDLDLRVRSYLDMNCAHCHGDLRHCDYRPMRFAFDHTNDPVNSGVCVDPHEPIAGQGHIFERGDAARSVAVYRLSSVDETVRMPLLGRTVVHQEAVDMISAWINGQSPACQ